MMGTDLRYLEQGIPSETEVESSARLAPLKHASLEERAYQELRSAIRAGRFTSGESVTIRGLAQMLGTSTMPVRAATHRLIQERILEMLPNRSMRVPLLSRRRFDELTDVRATVEGHAAALAAERMTDTEFHAVKAAHLNMLDAVSRGDTAEVLAANERFHFGIYNASRSEVLLSIITNLWDQSGPYISVMTRVSLGTAGMNEPPTILMGPHQAAIVALGNRDPEAARKEIAYDIQRSADWYRTSLFFRQENNAVDDEGKKL